MKHRFSLSRALLLIAAAAWLTACAKTPQSRFYTLTPLAPPETKQPSRDAAAQLSINVAPVEIPDYLDRPQIVTRNGRNEVVLAEFDRWAGSLGENISAVMAENLALLIGTDRVVVNPGAPFEKADYSVAMRVLRLDCLPGDHVLLKAQWTVFSGPAGKNAATHVSNITERLNDSRYDTTVAAVNQAVGQVSREIAREIMARPKEGLPNPPAQTGP